MKSEEEKQTEQDLSWTDRVKISWKRVSISLCLILLAVSSYGLYRTFATPSGQTQSIEGGGFCQGTYTVYNNTVDKLLYAQNCSTGVNDVAASTDNGALFNSVRALIEASAHAGGEIHYRSGFFATVTTAIYSTCKTNPCESGLVTSGSGWGGGFNAGTTGSNALNGTVWVAKTNGMTMLEATSGSPSVTCPNNASCSGTNSPAIRGNTIRDISFNANNLAAIGIDFRMTETATLNRFIELRFSGSVKFSVHPGFTTAMLLDGNEDTIVDATGFDGDGSISDSSATLDLQWQTPLGNVEISHAFFGGVLNLVVYSQIIAISQSTVSSVKIGGTCTACGQLLTIADSYLANQQGTGLFQLNGQTLNVMHLSGDTVTLSSTIPLYSGTGTVQNAGFASNVWAFVGVSNWNAGGATLTKQNTDGGNHVRSGSAPTNFPFTIDGNSNF